MKRLTRFPGGIVVDGFFTAEDCAIMRGELRQAEWIPALIARYDGNRLIRIEHDRKRSSAYVTKEFVFSSLKVGRLQSRLSKIIERRFHFTPPSYSKYGVSKYPSGAELALHSDTGVFNTRRLVTCVIYLHKGFKGGDIVFPDVGYRLSPREGMLVAFCSELRHRVERIVKGERLAVVLFAEAREGE